MTLIENATPEELRAALEELGEWSRREIALLHAELDSPYIQWCIAQRKRNRTVVALISPKEAHNTPRYAGYYCEDAPK